MTETFQEIDKLLTSGSNPQKEVNEIPKTEITSEIIPVEEKVESNGMNVETPADQIKSPNKKTTPKKKATPKKVVKKSPVTQPKKKVPEKEIITDPTKVTTRSKNHKNWSDLIYGSGERYTEGDTLAVRAPSDSGEQFWLCALDGIGTEENEDDLEVTWYEAKDGVYVEGEEDDIASETVICRTRLNIGAKEGTWVLPPVELKSIRDSLKLEEEDSSEIKEFSGDEESDKSFKEGDAGSDANVYMSRRSAREPRKNSQDKPKKELKPSTQGEKRKNANVDSNGEPKPKRAYKKREKKVLSTHPATPILTTTPDYPIITTIPAPMLTTTIITPTIPVTRESTMYTQPLHLQPMHIHHIAQQQQQHQLLQQVHSNQQAHSLMSSETIQHTLSMGTPNEHTGGAKPEAI